MKNKKSLVALVALAIVGVVGSTFAFFTISANFENVFETKPFHAELSEEFESPKEWLPGATTDKKVYAENTADVPVAVRVSYTEKWVNANGDEIDLVQTKEDGSKVTAAVINFANQEEWKEQDGYYVYNKILAKGETSSSFIESVTFNKDIEASYECKVETTTTAEGKKLTKKVCDSTGEGYDGATYTLDITVEVIQSDVAEAQWNLPANFFTNASTQEEA